MFREGWLKCDISEGMLPGEFAVSCTNADKNSLSFFASAPIVNQSTGVVRVNVLEYSKDHCVVFLPVTPIENFGRTIKVFRSSVRF